MPTNGGSYWKYKGGLEYCLAYLPISEVSKGEKYLNELANKLIKEYEIVYRNIYSEEYIIDWHIYAPTELTQDEIWELDYQKMCKEHYEHNCSLNKKGD